MSEERVKHLQVPVPFHRQLWRWFKGVGRAVLTWPPSTETKFQTLRPGDPGYDSAAFVVGRSKLTQSLLGNEFERIDEHTDECNES